MFEEHLSPEIPVTGFRKLDDQKIETIVDQINQARIATNEKKKRYLICLNCGHIVTDEEQRIEIAGSFSHTFTNPAGIAYHIGCFATAPGCFVYGSPTAEFTWFPGFTWVFAHCLKCLAHLGWFYQSGDDAFYGLILNKIKKALDS